MLRIAHVLAIIVLIAPGSSARGASPSYESCAAVVDVAGFTNWQLLECTTKDLDRADAALNATHRDTMAGLPLGRQATLRREERTWIDQRRARCALGSLVANPSRDLNRRLCLIHETDDRTGVLRAMR